MQPDMLVLAAEVVNTAPTNTIVLDALALSVLSGVLVPILVGIVTKMRASAGLKSVINALLSAAGGALATVAANNGALEPKEFIVGIGTTWMISIATYYGLYKPTGVAGTVAATTAGFGLGSPPTVETDEKGLEDVGRLPGMEDPYVAADLIAVPPSAEIPEPGPIPATPVPAKAAPKKAAAKKAAAKKES